MSGLRLVIFDVDGTLVDSQGQILAAMHDAFALFGRPAPDRQTLLSVVGLSLPQAIVRLVPDMSQEELEAAVDSYKASYQQRRASDLPAPLYPGARQVLDELAAREDVLLGIATGKSRRGLDHVLAEHGLERCFMTEQVADFHPSKPHPSMVQAAMAEAGVTAADTVMIGDTEFDMQMGQAAGVTTIGVTWGYHPAARLAGANRRIDRFDALPDVLAQIWETA